ncbi:MAG: response regulator transcription factor [Anaerolineae bacterium]|nr:response regulator transcription factor [Anaerolineae bacterium]
METYRILLADDEKALTDYLAPILERAGFAVTVVHDGETALRYVLEKHPDLIVLDLLMPGLNGRQICRQLRAAGDWTPVIMLTRVNTPVDKISSLEEGADDYLCKPFDPYELVARIRAVLRRRQGPAKSPPLIKASRLRSGDLILDRRTRRVYKGGRALEVTPKALALLEYLMLHPDEVLTRDRLLDAVWGWDYPVATRAVDVRIAEIRRALGDDPEHPSFVETIIGVGYRFLASVEPLEDMP